MAVSLVNYAVVNVTDDNLTNYPSEFSFDVEGGSDRALIAISSICQSAYLDDVLNDLVVQAGGVPMSYVSGIGHLDGGSRPAIVGRIIHKPSAATLSFNTLVTDGSSGRSNVLLVMEVAGVDETTAVAAVAAAIQTDNAHPSRVMTPEAAGNMIVSGIATRTLNGTPFVAASGVTKIMDLNTDGGTSISDHSAFAGFLIAADNTTPVETGATPAGELDCVMIAFEIKAATAGGGAVNGAGSATAPAATSTGSGLRAVSGTGEGQAPATETTGVGVRAVFGAGSALAPAATSTGSYSLNPSGSGAATAPAAISSGVGIRQITGSGTADAPSAIGSGTGVRAIEGAGAATAPASTASGFYSTFPAGTGAATAPAATSTGTGLRLINGSGAATAPRSRASGVGLRLISGSGSCEAPPATSTGYFTTLGLILPPEGRIGRVPYQSRVGLVPFVNRIGIVLGENDMIIWDNKDPEDILTYAIDYSAELDPRDDTIVSSTWDVHEDFTSSEEAFSGTAATIKLAGGIARNTYYITNQAVTAKGQTYNRKARLTVVDL